MLAVVVLLHTAVLGADVLAAHAVAYNAARIATTGSDEDMRAAVAKAAGDRPVEVSVDPPEERRLAGDLLAVTVRLRSSAFEPFGASPWIPATVMLRVERP